MSKEFGTGGQIIATLLVALVVEARTPVTRAGAAAARIPACSAGLLLGLGGVAAVIALAPGLPACVYQVLAGLTLGAVTGGLSGVVLLGIAIALASLRELGEASLKRLEELGDPSAAADLRKR
jgi:hypothetical protein